MIRISRRSWKSWPKTGEKWARTRRSPDPKGAQSRAPLSPVILDLYLRNRIKTVVFRNSSGPSANGPLDPSDEPRAARHPRNRGNTGGFLLASPPPICYNQREAAFCTHFFRGDTMLTFCDRDDRMNRRSFL